MRLIYLGQAFKYLTRTPQTYRTPDAINWRHQVPGKVYGKEVTRASTYLTPKVVSWRWQVLTN